MARVHLFKHSNDYYLDNENKTPTLTTTHNDNETVVNNASIQHETKIDTGKKKKNEFICSLLTHP
jgi:hypothetical protein